MRHLLLCLAAIASSPAWGAQFYVDQSHAVASDANTGDSENQPWSTVQHAAATAQAGDTVHVKNGTYTERVVFANSGADGSWITIKAYQGHAPVLDGSAAAQWDGFVNLMGVDYVRLEGLAIANCGTGQAVYIIHGTGNPATHIELKNLNIGTVDDSPVQIRGDASHILVEDCIVHHCGASGIDASSFAGGRPHHITIRGNTAHDSSFAGVGSEMADDLLVEHNTVYDCSIGLDIGSGDDNVLRDNIIHGCGDGIYLSSNEDSLVHDNVVYDVDEALASYYFATNGEAHARNKWYRNTVHNATWALYEMDRKTDAFASGPTSGHQYYNNVFYDIGGNSYRAQFWFRGVDDFAFRNNTVYMRADSETFELVDGAEGGEFTNNVVSVSGSFTLFTISGDSSASVDYNCWHARAGSVSAVGANDVVGDPGFVDPAGGDFRVQTGSPCIDEGVTLTDFSEDKDGTTRPQGTAWDMGAYESIPSGPPPQAIDVTAPAAGASFRGKQDVVVSWTTVAFADPVVIELSTDGGASWAQVAGPLTGVSWHTIEIPNVDAPACAVRVADDADGNPAGESGTFAIASITDTDGDRLDDAWELAHWTSLTESDGTGDVDADGASDLEEFWAGTDPTVPQLPAADSGVSCACDGNCSSTASATLIVLLAVVLGRGREGP